jgi:hypothetical protein
MVSRRRNKQKSRRRSRKVSRKRSRKRSRKVSRKVSGKRSRGGVKKSGSLDAFLRSTRPQNVPTQNTGVFAPNNSPPRRVHNELNVPIANLARQNRSRFGKIQEFIRAYLRYNHVSTQTWKHPEMWTATERRMLEPLDTLTVKMRTQRWKPAHVMGFPISGVNIREWMQNNPNATKYV